jgi:recombination protein RecA
MGQSLRKLVPIVAENNVCVIFINQTRDTIGKMYAPQKFTPGGRALDYAASVRMEIRRTEWIKSGESTIGSRIKAKIVKNKVARPYTEASFDLIFGKGFSRVAMLFEMAVEKGIITKKGSWHYLLGEAIGQGKENAMEFIENNQEHMVYLENELSQ